MTVTRHTSDIIDMTSLDEIPGATVVRHLGTISLHVIKETLALREAGGMARFLQQFITDVHSLARAQAAARGGAAVVSMRVRRLWARDSPGRNQGQALVTLTGDVVDVHYHAAPPQMHESEV